MEIDPDVLRRYWRNECSEEEERQVTAWLNAGEPAKDYPAGSELNEELENELWAGVSQDASFRSRRSHSAENRNRPERLKKRRLMIGSMAASVFLAVALGCLILWKGNWERVVPVAQYREIVVPYGKKMTVTLSDSTRISLNSGSVLKYPERFAGARRHVLLEGEAFFQVAHDAEHPFIVETDRSATRVLGTRFNLRSFSGEGMTRVTVGEGSVEFTGKACSDTLILRARDQGLFAGGIMDKKSDVDVATYTGWRKSILSFDDIPLKEAIPVIERWYDVDVSLGDPSLSRLRVTGSFQDPSLRRLLKDFAYLMNLNYRIEQRHVLLYK